MWRTALTGRGLRAFVKAGRDQEIGTCREVIDADCLDHRGD